MLTEGKGSDKFTAQQIKTVKQIGGRQAYKNIRDRVDLEFKSSNRKLYGMSDSVQLSVWTKHNPSLEVNVYRVNTKNYYKQMQQEIPQDINLSGSCPIASFELTNDAARGQTFASNHINTTTRWITRCIRH
jgi:hypothetical protein